MASIRFYALQMSGDGHVAAILGKNDKLYVLMSTTERCWRQPMPNANSASLPMVRESCKGLGSSMWQAALKLSSRDVCGWRSAISADGRLGMASIACLGSVVWKLDSGEILKDAAYYPGFDFNRNSQLRGALSADGRYSISCSNDFNVYLYDTQAGEQLAVVSVDASEIADFAFSADGSDLLIATRYGTWHHYRFENLPP